LTQAVTLDDGRFAVAALFGFVVVLVALSLVVISWWEIRRARLEARVLACLARLLPAQERQRFVVEQEGNLGDCERWWQRAVWLAGLTMGLPRFAWTMHRTERRVFAYRSSNGTTYYLHSRVVTLRDSGRRTRIYYFAPQVRPDDSVGSMPAGHRVRENPRNGLLIIARP
jgi:hypothetical protein